MSNNGLSYASELVYVENIIPYLLCEKVVDRALRGHEMVETALHTILLEDIISSKDVDYCCIQQLLQEAIDSKLDVINIFSF